MQFKEHLPLCLQTFIAVHQWIPTSFRASLEMIDKIHDNVATGVWKFCEIKYIAKWLPRFLLNEIKHHRVVASKTLLGRIPQNLDEFLRQCVTVYKQMIKILRVHLRDEVTIKTVDCWRRTGSKEREVGWQVYKYDFLESTGNYLHRLFRKRRKNQRWMLTIPVWVLKWIINCLCYYVANWKNYKQAWKRNWLGG